VLAPLAYIESAWEIFARISETLMPFETGWMSLERNRVA